MRAGEEAKSRLPLREGVSRKVSAEYLSKQQLSRLDDLQQQLAANFEDKSQFRWTNYRFIVTSTILFLFFTYAFQQYFPLRQNFSKEIALGMANHHLSLEPLALESNSMASLREFFQLLDFPLHSSTVLGEQFSLFDQSLLGGRYCSLKGISAALLRYQSPDIGLGTVYEAAYDEGVFGFIPEQAAPLKVIVKGLVIHLWVEKGLLIGLVLEEQ